MMMPKGTLIPIGGNEDKGNDLSEHYSLDFISEGILYQVVHESGGPEGTFLVIPTASSIPQEVGDNYIEAFAKLGCENVTVLDIRSKADADKTEYLRLVEKADCIMFSGGDQSKIAARIGGTQMHTLLQKRYIEDEGFVIAGTSAGAMAMSQEMIAGGSSTESFIKGAVRMRQGLGLLPEVMFDTHFIQRGRFGRVSEALARHPQLLGIGLAEDTGLVVKGGDEMTVIGSGMGIIFEGSQISHNNYENLEVGIPLTLTGMKVHVLSDSDKYYIKDRKVRVLEVEEYRDLKER